MTEQRAAGQRQGACSGPTASCSSRSPSRLVAACLHAHLQSSGRFLMSREILLGSLSLSRRLIAAVQLLLLLKRSGVLLSSSSHALPWSEDCSDDASVCCGGSSFLVASCRVLSCFGVECCLNWVRQLVRNTSQQAGTHPDKSAFLKQLTPSTGALQPALGELIGRSTLCLRHSNPESRLAATPQASPLK
jgi:hypothetical protein